MTNEGCILHCQSHSRRVRFDATHPFYTTRNSRTRHPYPFVANEDNHILGRFDSEYAYANFPKIQLNPEHLYAAIILDVDHPSDSGWPGGTPTPAPSWLVLNTRGQDPHTPRWGSSRREQGLERLTLNKRAQAIKDADARLTQRLTTAVFAVCYPTGVTEETLHNANLTWTLRTRAGDPVGEWSEGGVSQLAQAVQQAPGWAMQPLHGAWPVGSLPSYAFRTLPANGQTLRRRPLESSRSQSGQVFPPSNGSPADNIQFPSLPCQSTSL